MGQQQGVPADELSLRCAAGWTLQTADPHRIMQLTLEAPAKKKTRPLQTNDTVVWTATAVQQRKQAGRGLLSVAAGAAKRQPAEGREPLRGAGRTCISHALR